MSTVTERIQALKPHETFCSFEFFPPKTDTGFRNLLARMNRMTALNPLFLTVTWGAGGSTSEKSLDLAATCQKELGITTVLHLTCTNTNKEVIDNALARAKDAGIRNILALRGDPPRTEEYWTPDCDFKNAVDLVRYIKQEHGDFFCIGVAGYPEGHIDGANMSQQNPQKDLPYLIEKVQAGASFIVTQLFFDVQKFVAYEKLLQNTPELAHVVLIPGLMPITTYRVFISSTKLSHASVPDDVLDKLEAPGNDDDMVKAIGIDILTKMIAEIHEKTHGRTRGFHFYTLNLEKAVASILEKSTVLQLTANDEVVDHEDAIGSDSETEDVPLKRKTRNNSSGSMGADDAKLALISRALTKDRRALVDISTGKGVLGKDATWDEFPNGRFGDSNSPAYGEIDGYGPSLKLSPDQVHGTWGSPESLKDISKLFTGYLTGRINVLPWVDSEISSETALIQEQLIELNERGWFTLASQPASNGCVSSDKLLGWGPPNGNVFQKAFVEFFISKEDWENKLWPRIEEKAQDHTITYFLGDASNKIVSNLRRQSGHNSKSAITWGVFPSKEVLQPTVIDFESFKAWNEEAFLLWIEWARCYKRNTPSFELLSSIKENFYLVSMIYHDFTDEYGLWNVLLDE